MGNQTDTKFTWVIKKFSSLQSESVYSDIFVVGRCRWRLLAFPKGNNKAKNHFSLYLRVADSEFLPFGWKRHAKVSFTIVNQFSEKLSQLKETQYWFDDKAPDWGFLEMITLPQLRANEFLVNGDLIVEVKVDVLQVVGKLDVSEESSTVMETIDVNGFQVLPSQVESVNRLFERHQDIALRVRPKNPYLKTAYMNVLLSLTHRLCQSPLKVSKDDLGEQYAALSHLKDAGFELGWLEKQLDEVKEKKEKEEACLARLKGLEEQLQPLKQKCLDLEAQMDKEKAELLAVRASLWCCPKI